MNWAEFFFWFRLKFCASENTLLFLFWSINNWSNIQDTILFSCVKVCLFNEVVLGGAFLCYTKRQRCHISKLQTVCWKYNWLQQTITRIIVCCSANPTSWNSIRWLLKSSFFMEFVTPSNNKIFYTICPLVFSVSSHNLLAYPSTWFPSFRNEN